jgi:hypothetical protein
MISQQLGRVLLIASVAVTAASTGYNTYLGLDPVPEADLQRAVQVELDTSTLAVSAAEIYFAAGPATAYLGEEEKYLFVLPKKVRVFVPVELEIPPAGVMRSAQVLPDPGPSLDGSLKLPRYGEEFPPITVAPADPKKTPPKPPKPPEKAP